MRLYYDELRERFRSAFGQTTSHLNVCFGSNRTENQFGTHPLAVLYWRVIWDGFIRRHSMDFWARLRSLVIYIQHEGPFSFRFSREGLREHSQPSLTTEIKMKATDITQHSLDVPKSALAALKARSMGKKASSL
jgi:hypothetical protein